MDLAHGRSGRENSLGNIPVRTLRIETSSSNPVQRTMFLHLLSQLRKKEKRASLLMMGKSDLTSEEQETVRKSKDP